MYAISTQLIDNTRRVFGFRTKDPEVVKTALFLFGHLEDEWIITDNVYWDRFTQDGESVEPIYVDVDEMPDGKVREVRIIAYADMSSFQGL